MIKKQFNILLILLGTFLYAQEIIVESGWQLKGTENGFTHMESFNKECINTVWTYDNAVGWKAYSGDAGIKSAIESSAAVQTLDIINKNEGFWINAQSDCNISSQLGALELPEDLQYTIDGNVSTLTEDVKNSLAYMGNEERLAYDVYNALYALFPDVKQFTNIASNSEYKHISAVQQLIQKYDIKDTELSSVEGALEYSDVPIESMEAGKYDIPAIQDLYDILYAKGANSKIDALEVGCMVEVTDIEDLDTHILQAQESNATDVEDVFVFLRDGSYSHYWAFDKGLINQGVPEGCCSIGVLNGIDYCHPEYPKSTNGAL